MATKTVLGGIAATALAAGMLVSGGPAHAGDDSKARSGTCSRGSFWLMVLTDIDRGDQDRLRTQFLIDGTIRDNAVWRVTFKRNGNIVHRATKRTDDGGNTQFATRFRGHDDAFVRVIARSGYGERCSHGMSLDR